LSQWALIKLDLLLSIRFVEVAEAEEESDRLPKAA